MNIPEYIPEDIKNLMMGFSDEQNQNLIEGFEKTGRMETWRLFHEIQKGIDDGRWTIEDIHKEILKRKKD